MSVKTSFLEITSQGSSVLWSGMLDLISSTWGSAFCVNIFCVGCVRMLEEVQEGHFLAVTHLHLKICHFSTDITLK